MDEADLMNKISGTEKCFASSLMMNAINVKLLVASNIQRMENMEKIAIPTWGALIADMDSNSYWVSHC